MTFTWTFTTGSQSLFVGRLSCWPIIPGTIIITAQDGNPAHDKVLQDNGEGILYGDGEGAIDYSYGLIELDFTIPLPDPGTEIKASYKPREGGCSDSCGKCATNKIQLNLSPASISGQGDLAIADAWQRLFDKIERDVLPYHVELIHDEYRENYIWSLAHRFDIIPGDAEPLDTGGLHLVFDSTDW